MKSRVTFVSLACLLSGLLAFVSCSPAPSAGPTVGAAVTAVATAVSGAATAAVPKATAPSAASPPAAASPAAQLPLTAPKYGGTLTTYSGVDITNFDSGTKGQGGWGLITQYQQYMGTDWMKGPAGGGPPDYFLNGTGAVEDVMSPVVAESWKMPAQGVWVLQIRKGMRWQKVDSEAGRLMGGREVTADDVVSSLQRLLKAEKSWINVSQPAVAKATTVEKTGDWEVTVKTPVDYLTSFNWIINGGGFNGLYPPEVVAKYGDLADWHNAVGTGAYMLTDYVKGSSWTYTKNPDYWETDPAGPGKGNKLPYIDTLKTVIIPDASTQQAAFRTGKVDTLPSATKEDAQAILKDNPQVVNFRYMAGLGTNSSYGIAMPINKQDLPYKDQRVRQAMMLATDFNALSQTLYGGDAEIDVWPATRQITALFQPLSEMPQADQDLFKYNPDKAKQLLAEAGYPNGFKATIATQNDPQLLDELAVYKQMWSKVGIDLSISPMDNAAFVGMNQARTNPDLIYRYIYTNLLIVMLYLSPYRGTSSNNPSFIDDPVGTVPAIEAINDEINKNVFVSWPNTYAAWKKLKPIVLEGAYVVPRPQPYVYSMWWPWVKNYYGGFFQRYAWIDQDLKKAMGK